jgi:hypothetical protein
LSPKISEIVVRALYLKNKKEFKNKKELKKIKKRKTPHPRPTPAVDGANLKR